MCHTQCVLHIVSMYFYIAQLFNQECLVNNTKVWMCNNPRGTQFFLICLCCTGFQKYCLQNRSFSIKTKVSGTNFTKTSVYEAEILPNLEERDL